MVDEHSMVDLFYCLDVGRMVGCRVEKVSGCARSGCCGDVVGVVRSGEVVYACE